MNVTQLLRLISRLCELEGREMGAECVWICGPHRFTAPADRDKNNSVTVWRLDGLLLQRLSWHELMRVASHIADCI